MDRLLLLAGYDNKLADLAVKEFGMEILLLDDWSLNNILDIVEDMIDEKTIVRFNSLNYL